MIIIRSLLFNLFLYSWTSFIAILFLPFLLLTNQILLTKIVGNIWAYGLKYGLLYICKIKVEVRGKENLPERPFIVASKHQSALETIMFYTVFSDIVFILKKELLFLPIYGIYLARMGMITIDRKGGASSIKKMLKDAKKALNLGRTLIIYPEGTRGRVGEKIPYKPGVAAIYLHTHKMVVPLALNSGEFWPKGSFLKYPGTCVFEIKPPLPANLPKDEFMERLEQAIEAGISV